MTELWLGVDLGTTGTRCIAFDAELTVVGSAYRENPPQFLPGGKVEQDARSWFDTTAEAIVEVVEHIRASSVVGLAISSQGITIVPVAADGTALRPAISWLDLRGEEMLPELARRVCPHDLRRATGKPWSGAYTLPKVMWLAKHEPEVLRDAAWLLCPLDYLHLRLTGRAVTDHSIAAGTMAYRLSTQAWDEELLASLNLDLRLFPQIEWAGSEAGRILPEVAARLGLPEVPVMVGGQDQKCAALAAGIGPGVTTLSLGTSGALESLHSGPDEPSEVPTFSFLSPGMWVREAPIETAGAAHRWVTRILSKEADYGEMERLVAHAGDDRPLFFPYLSRFGVQADRDRWGAEPAGVFWGLGLNTERGDLAGAVLEGVAFEVERYLRLMDDNSSMLRIFGGGARSASWCRVLADVTGRRVETLSSPEAAAAGAAMLAGAPGRLPMAASYEPGEAKITLQARGRHWSKLRQHFYEHEAVM